MLKFIFRLAIKVWSTTLAAGTIDLGRRRVLGIQLDADAPGTFHDYEWHHDRPELDIKSPSKPPGNPPSKIGMMHILSDGRCLHQDLTPMKKAVLLNSDDVAH